jgi:hypothetical protein
MAKCGIGVLLGTECGHSFHKGRTYEEMVRIDQCQRGLKGHLNMLKLSDAGIDSEGDLICYRAGNFQT